VLLDVEVSGVEHSPEAGSALGKEPVPELAEDEGDDLKEKLTDIDGLRAEVEDLQVGERRSAAVSSLGEGSGARKRLPCPRTAAKQVKPRPRNHILIV
jgi:hypothetical protein